MEKHFYILLSTGTRSHQPLGHDPIFRRKMFGMNK